MNAPIYKALSRRILIGLLPRSISIALGTIAAALILGLHSLYMIPILVIIYVLLVLLYKRDEYMLEIIVRSLKQPDYYHP